MWRRIFRRRADQGHRPAGAAYPHDRAAADRVGFPHPALCTLPAVVEAAFLKGRVLTLQAQQYATAIKVRYGVLPIVFCTNGYETIVWDGTYPERPVFSVFSKDDLRRLINRRSTRGDFSDIRINDDITDRPYQKAAIHATCSHFKKCNRKALLAMATGTGKTRTAASLIDVLLQQNWITNILSLADRREFVKQAKDAFVKHLPSLSTCNLSKRDPSETPAARAVFFHIPDHDEFN